ncbi:hypothetical protein EV138_4652 [Kribbella voronezhensis]|uniref:Uncharacterized protein n=1 Tax=Kribbella voronezhensis TaxID=2512212 RepID=A0A4R7TFN5_9ACTN|nr:hypothetical protein [Kribbella voronezhensis]TDU91051.1 hypothetical protein EV138_4652 [Kribbella voronezhensis]
MTDQLQAPSQQPVRRPRASLWVLRLVLLLHTGLVVTQPIMAGYYLSGDADAMDVHSPIGSTLWMISMVQLVPALLYWRPGGGRLWPAGLTFLLFFAEFLQMIVGHSQNLAIHVPLGTAIVLTVVALTIWSFRPAARRGRRKGAQ